MNKNHQNIHWGLALICALVVASWGTSGYAYQILGEQVLPEKNGKPCTSLEKCLAGGPGGDTKGFFRKCPPGPDGEPMALFGLGVHAGANVDRIDKLYCQPLNEQFYPKPMPVLVKGPGDTGGDGGGFQWFWGKTSGEFPTTLNIFSCDWTDSDSINDLVVSKIYPEFAPGAEAKVFGYFGGLGNGSCDALGPYSFDSLECPAGSVMTGVYGHAGDRVDSLGIFCNQRQTVKCSFAVNGKLVKQTNECKPVHKPNYNGANCLTTQGCLKDTVTNLSLCLDLQDKDPTTTEFYYCHMGTNENYVSYSPPASNTSDNEDEKDEKDVPPCTVTVSKSDGELRVSSSDLTDALATCEVDEATESYAALKFVGQDFEITEVEGPIVVELHHPLKIIAPDATSLWILLPEQSSGKRRLMFRRTANYNAQDQTCAVDVAQDNLVSWNIIDVIDFPTTGLCISGSDVTLGYLHVADNQGDGILITGSHVRIGGTSRNNTGFGIRVAKTAQGFSSQLENPEIYVRGNAKGGISFSGPPLFFSEIYARLAFHHDQIATGIVQGQKNNFSPGIALNSVPSWFAATQIMTFDLTRPQGTSQNDTERVLIYGAGPADSNDVYDRKYFPVPASCSYFVTGIVCNVKGPQEILDKPIISYQRLGELPKFTVLSKEDFAQSTPDAPQNTSAAGTPAPQPDASASSTGEGAPVGEGAQEVTPEVAGSSGETSEAGTLPPEAIDSVALLIGSGIGDEEHDSTGTAPPQSVDEAPGGGCSLLVAGTKVNVDGQSCLRGNDRMRKCMVVIVWIVLSCVGCGSSTTRLSTGS